MGSRDGARVKLAKARIAQYCVNFLNKKKSLNF